ncbi:MAG: AAA family ATPase [Lachnospiraceae bacterium]|nr:AAA family ATPase [Lachnospiraceae bacterium]
MSESNDNARPLEAINAEKGFRQQVGFWLRATSYNSFHNEIAKSVIGQDALEDITLSIYLYMERVAKGRHNKGAILLCAPSGCGKTETYRAVRTYFEKHLPFLPCYQTEMSRITQTGFKGDEPISVADGLMDKHYTNGIGICWLDEVDKVIEPTYATHSENVSAKIQQGLLCLLEGCIIKGENTNDGKPRQICTANTLFIGIGSFNYIREYKQNNNKHKLGFSSVAEEEISHYTDLTRQDIIEGGGLWEFIGRFSSIYNYHSLSDEAVRKIIALMRREESLDIGIDIVIEESTFQALIKESNSEFGCRLLRSMIHDRVMAKLKVIKKSYRNCDIAMIRLSEEGDTITFCPEQRREMFTPFASN